MGGNRIGGWLWIIIKGEGFYISFGWNVFYSFVFMISLKCINIYGDS